MDKTSISVWKRLSESCRSLRIFLENFTTWTVYDALTRELLLQIPERRRDCDIILGLRIKKICRPLLSVITCCHLIDSLLRRGRNAGIRELQRTHSLMFFWSTLPESVERNQERKKKKDKTFFPLENKALGSFVVKLNRNLTVTYYTGRDLPPNT